MAWVNSSVKAASWRTVSFTREESVRAILLALFLVLTATFSIREQDPPPAVSAAVSPELFSAGRAVRHLSVIAEKPHPMGSTEHKVVQDYLVRQLSEAGVEPQIQAATIPIQKGPPVQVGSVENVMARLKGTNAGKALLLVAHYDSVANSYGASDDGSSVASLLETLRALKAGPPLKNDVIFLFTDGEENGLLGARAFVSEHPWAKDTGVVLNFEARGNSGPVIMFETTNNNCWLIQQFAEAAPFPMGHSLSYEIYRLLPNDTDMTVFKKAGMAGLNFANIDGINHYHTPLDNLQGVDQDSIQHQGSYSLALARHLGNMDLSQPRSGNAIYFDLFGKWLVRYSSVWAIPLTVLISALFVTLAIAGLRRQRLTVRRIAWGFIALFVSLVIASLAGWLLWKLAWLIRSGPSAEASQSRLLLLGFVALAISITLAVYTFVRKRVDTASLVTGALLWWLVLMVATSLFLPGATYIFHWPLLFSLFGLGWMIFAPQNQKTDGLLSPLILSVCALPAIILVAPVIYQMFVGLTLNWSILVISMLVLLLGLLLPHLRFIATPFKWALSGATAAAAIVLLAAGVFTTAGTANKQASRIYYALNADNGKAVWASELTDHDERTAQLFNGAQEKGSLADFAYGRKSRQYTLVSAPPAPLPAPEISVVEDKAIDGVRTLRMKVSSPRQAGTVSVYLDSNAEVLSSSLDNKPINDEPRNQWGVNIDGFPRQGVELQLQVRTSEPLKIRVVDQSFGLPALNATPTSQLSAKPDTTLLVKSFSL